jgi:hypothetical protein
MTEYFPGRRQIGKTTQSYEKGKASLLCTVFEHWKDLDSKTAYCGADASLKIAATIGLTQTDSEKIKASFGSSIGVEKVASLKSSLESEIRREICWELSSTREDTFSFKAPECGRRTETIYQLIHEYDLYYSRKRLIRKPFTWQTTLTEYVKCYRAIPDKEDFDPVCKCPTRPEPKLWKTIDVDVDSFTLEAAYRRTNEGMEIDFGDQTIVLPYDGSEYFRRVIPTAVLPNPMRFLCDLTSDSVEASFRPQPVEIATSIPALPSVVPAVPADYLGSALVMQIVRDLEVRYPNIFDTSTLRRGLMDLLRSTSAQQREETVPRPKG